MKEGISRTEAYMVRQRALKRMTAWKTDRRRRNTAPENLSRKALFLWKEEVWQNINSVVFLRNMTRETTRLRSQGPLRCGCRRDTGHHRKLPPDRRTCVMQSSRYGWHRRYNIPFGTNFAYGLARPENAKYAKGMSMRTAADFLAKYGIAP
jgi:hypothetical protein